ncbi:ornithine carbamoyltransferase [Streptomyces tsukubensis]|uniref:Ornithine carbamoyltransferase n=1 Tax=Streptomyces tsukubensis TaxID=83656 RepID=A0A1V4A2B6_9ACTN|nr:ornithine carbamoyltransferase [Streptomyces tsukubensis]OON72751.1 ornithine carbamoyltransferase [Streptomyces tsukubensis]QFR96851.1 ornithine carbamoyltransferase [Streptomyces tsukubensis]
MNPLYGAPGVAQERGLFSLAELKPDALLRLVERSVELFRDREAHDFPLRDRVAGVLFTRTSTRTRTAFQTGIVRLGGTPVAYGPHDLQLNTGESVTDTARVLGSMLDLLVARTSGPLDELRKLSSAGGLPLINAMATEEHPTQGVCDLATLALAHGDLSGLRVMYIGEGNNTAVALAHGMAMVPGARVTFVTPPGYGLPGGVLAAARGIAGAAGAELAETHDVADAPTEVDVVYTTRWQTTGTDKGDPDWRETFRPFHVDAALMRRWPDASFLHDLPAHRGDEVAGEVLDGPRSLAWTQATMKLSSAMAVLEATAGPAAGDTRR